MQLRDYEIPKATIPLPGKTSFEVRGLTTADISFLIENHLGPITRAVKLYQESRADILTGGNLNKFVMALAGDAPQLVAEVISAAADSLDDKTRAIAKQLPITVQIAAMAEIARLTMQESDGLKNLLAETVKVLQVNASALQSEPAPPKAAN